MLGKLEAALRGPGKIVPASPLAPPAICTMPPPVKSITPHVEQDADPTRVPGPRDDHGAEESRYEEKSATHVGLRLCSAQMTMVAAAMQKAHRKNQLSAVPAHVISP